MICMPWLSIKGKVYANLEVTPESLKAFQKSRPLMSFLAFLLIQPYITEVKHARKLCLELGETCKISVKSENTAK